MRDYTDLCHEELMACLDARHEKNPEARDHKIDKWHMLLRKKWEMEKHIPVPDRRI